MGLHICKLCHNKPIFKKVQHIHSESLVRVQSNGRSHARHCRGSLIGVMEELRSQRTPGLSLNPRVRGTKRESGVTVVLVPGPPGMIWNHGRIPRLTLEPRRKGFTAEAGNMGKCCQSPSGAEVGREPGFSPPLFPQVSPTGSLCLGP